jgi:hypothetical protein
MGCSTLLLMFWLFSIFWHPLIRIGHRVTAGFFVASFYRGFSCLHCGSKFKFHTQLILFQHICLWVMILFHALSCCLRSRDSSVGIVIIQYKPTKCTFPKLIFYQLYQLPGPQYITHSSTYKAACTLTRRKIRRWFFSKSRTGGDVEVRLPS